MSQGHLVVQCEACVSLLLQVGDTEPATSHVLYCKRSTLVTGSNRLCPGSTASNSLDRAGKQHSLLAVVGRVGRFVLNGSLFLRQPPIPPASGSQWLARMLLFRTLNLVPSISRRGM